MNTVGTSWLVCRQFYKNCERFAREEEARAYASKLAEKCLGEKVEVFCCVSNVFVDLPVVTISEQEQS
jgi:hypothetical protein